MRLDKVVQPAREVMREKKIRINEAAGAIGVPTRHLAFVLRGRTHPMDAVREQLPVILGAPLEELFTPELLAKRYDKSAAARPAKKARQS